MNIDYKALFSDTKMPGHAIKIYTYPAKVLKKISQPITEFDEQLKDLTINMLHTMYQAPGIGLAAPQVGTLKRLFVMDTQYERDETLNSDETTSYSFTNLNPQVFINPEIVQTSGEILTEEGCLSVPGVYESVKRYEQITFKYQTISGESKTIQAEGLKSICLQHELDHLNGVVFIEKLSLIKQNLIKKKIAKTKKLNQDNHE